MSDLPARYTIERRIAPAFRGTDGQEPKRFLGHDDGGRLGWMRGFVHANTYSSAADARSFKTHRLGMSAEARIVRHNVH